MSMTQNAFVKYAVLPGFWPRLKRLLASGFRHISYLMALIYESLGLLPSNHPYVNPQNIGRFGIRHVIAEAANNLVLDRRHADQILIFLVLLGGLGLLIAQFVFLIFALLATQPAIASPFDPTTLFFLSHPLNPGPEQDIVFRILDLVFGLEGIFNSCVSSIPQQCEDMNGNVIDSTATQYPYPFHEALHGIFQFYSLGIFTVAVLVMLYFIATIVAETAATGQPFGQRFNKGWVAVRIIVFFALLVPLNVEDPGENSKPNSGLNGAQIITFWTAKLGSNLATNAWAVFNDALLSDDPQNTTYLGRKNQALAVPETPDVAPLVQAVFMAHACRVAEGVHGNDVRAYLVKEDQKMVFPAPSISIFGLLGEAASYFNAMNFNGWNSMTIRFGTELDSDHPEYGQSKGGIFPHCGDLTLPIDSRDFNSLVFSMHAVYYELVRELWEDQEIFDHAKCMVVNEVPTLHHLRPCTDIPDADFAKAKANEWQEWFDNRVAGVASNRDTIDWDLVDVVNGDVNANLINKGWGGAAIWYNRIAQINGSFTTAIHNMPLVSKYPYLLEYIMEKRRGKSENAEPTNLMKPELPNGDPMPFEREGDEMLAGPMAQSYSFWTTDLLTENTNQRPMGNAFYDIIQAIFGTSGLYNMRSPENENVHPLAQLSSVGRSLMDASIRNIAGGFLGGVAAKILGTGAGDTLKVGAQFFQSVGFLTIAFGVVLFYVLPFMPFIYFFLAAGIWVKAIFEAIVAMPLWALAHIRIDGEGLPGSDASNGYFLLLDILLRPILLVFGLLASLTIFGVLVHQLNDIYDLVVSNLTGYNISDPDAAETLIYKRDLVDEFFFTALYTVIVYLLATSCFKLIDAVPNQILRWTGSDVETFGEQAENQAGQLIQQVYRATVVSTGQLRGGALAALL